MTVEIREPELERRVGEEIRNGRFQNVDDLFAEALQALREKQASPGTSSRPRKNLAQFLMESPFAGSDLDLERRQNFGLPIDF